MELVGLHALRLLGREAARSPCHTFMPGYELQGRSERVLIGVVGVSVYALIGPPMEHAVRRITDKLGWGKKGVFGNEIPQRIARLFFNSVLAFGLIIYIVVDSSPHFCWIPVREWEKGLVYFTATFSDWPLRLLIDTLELISGVVSSRIDGIAWSCRDLFPK